MFSSAKEVNYTPRDHTKSSIRLVKILPNISPQGHIQLRSFHTTINETTKYKCLSYVWGPPDTGTWVLLDSQPFKVRTNLAAFLSSARHMYSEQWFWIDVLCIDQENARVRNYQVQCMSFIFSQAEEVVAWLGESLQVAHHLADIREKRINKSLIRNSGLKALVSCDYWDRAWITQEVILARSVTLMAFDETLALAKLPWDMLAGSQKPRGIERVLKFNPELNNSDNGRSLVYLLWNFRGKGCASSRDRIFSLLAICGDGADLRVDYSIPREELALNALRSLTTSFCLCSTQIIGDALRVSQPLSTSHCGSTLRFATCEFKILEYHRPLRHIWYYWTIWQNNVNESPALVQLPRVLRIRYMGWTFRYTTELFTLRMNDLCDAYSGCLTLRIRKSRPGFDFVVTKGKGFQRCDSGSTTMLWGAERLPEGRYNYRERGVELVRGEDEETCRLNFSFDFLLEISRLAPRVDEVGGPCKKVCEAALDTRLKDHELQLVRGTNMGGKSYESSLTSEKTSSSLTSEKTSI